MMIKFCVITVDSSILPIDMFGKYSGVVRGFGVTATSVAFFLNPILMGFMVSDHVSIAYILFYVIIQHQFVSIVNRLLFQITRRVCLRGTFTSFFCAYSMYGA